MSQVFATCDRCGKKDRCFLFPQVKKDFNFDNTVPILKRCACIKCIAAEDNQRLKRAMVERGWHLYGDINNIWVQFGFIMQGYAPRGLLEL